MIILELDDAVPYTKHVQHPASSLPRLGLTPPSPALPDYETSQAQAENQTIVSKHSPQLQVGRRFWKSVLYALVIYLALSAVIAIPLLVLKLRRSRFGSPPRPREFLSLPPLLSGLPPDVANLPSVDGLAVQCNSWQHGSNDTVHAYYPSLQYKLPLNGTVYLRSNMSYTEDALPNVSGTLDVRVRSASDSDGKEALVSVRMKCNGKDSCELVSVCMMHTDDGWGLGIYIPRDLKDTDVLEFNVELRLPKLIHIQELATYLPGFKQTFSHLDPYVTFEKFTVQGAMSPVDVSSVTAEKILVKTSAAEIKGRFNASESLVLETVLAPVSADIVLVNDSKRKAPTTLSLETGSSPINANITLSEPFDVTPGCRLPLFMTKLKTFGAALEANYHHHPTTRPSILFVKAQNTLEHARVYLDPKFEGTYDVHTNLAEAIVDRQDVLDPTGMRQRQYIDDHVSSDRALGWVGWDKRPDGKERAQQGHVEVVSSLSPAVLFLTDGSEPQRTVRYTPQMIIQS